VTRALAIDRARHDRRDLARGALLIAAHAAPPALAIGPRIGVAYAGAWADAPLRFAWPAHPAVSRPPPCAAAGDTAPRRASRGRGSSPGDSGRAARRRS